MQYYKKNIFMQLMSSILFALLLVMTVPAHSLEDHPITVINDESQLVDLLSKDVSKLYFAESAEALDFQPGRPVNLNAFLDSLSPASRIGGYGGGGYWLFARIDNQSNLNKWVVDSRNTVIDNLKLFVYTRNDVQEYTSGYLHPFLYPLHYGIDIDLPVGESYLLLYVQSRLYAGNPRFELLKQTDYLKLITTENTIALGCLAAILILGFYNLIVGFSLRDKSFLYYSGYLFVSLFGWLGVFNGLADWFELYSYKLIMAPFFLANSLNILYFIHFLDLRSSHPSLMKWCYALAFTGIAVTVLIPFMSPPVYSSLLVTLYLAWMITAFVAGTLRVKGGFKPAWYFITGFSILVVGIFLSSWPSVGFVPLARNNFLTIAVAQTIDIFILSIALAERIRLYHIQKEQALEDAYHLQQEASETEKQANIKLQKALDLSEQESQRKTDFLRMVSHELHSPLHAIVSSVDQWEEIDDKDSQRDLVNYIGYGAAKLKTQVDNLILLAETDDDAVIPKQISFELRPLLDRLFVSTERMISQDVYFEKPNMSALPIAYIGDAYLVEHLLRVILENSAKYTSTGKIELDLSWDEHRSSMLIVLKDTGAGMSRDQLKGVFNEFVQVSRGNAKESEGLGLGLTICYRLCELLNADFKIESELGVGTQLAIELPLQAIESGPRLVEAPAETNGSLLIVDDNPVNAATVRRTINHLGFQAEVVLSGQQALEILNLQSFNLILMDLEMPIMDGITTSRWIRQRGINTPIVALSDHIDIELRKKVIEHGMNDLLIKPVKRSDIERLIERQLPVVER